MMVLAKMDSTAFIHDYAFGASSTISGLVAAIGVADALRKVGHRAVLCFQ